MNVYKTATALCLLIVPTLAVFAQNRSELVLPKVTSDPVIMHMQNPFNNLDSQNPKHFLQVFVETKNQEYQEQFAIQGSYKVVENCIVFKSDFPLMEGQNYIARVIDLTHSDKIEYTNTSFRILKKDIKIQAKVVNVFPSSIELPENTIRFYIYFETPMKKEVAIQHVHLIDEDDIEVKHVFMKFKRELWSPDGKRLTLLFDPGRIKRGVSTYEEIGAALHIGKSYKLVISHTWTDVFNQPLNGTFTKTFEVIEAYRTAINTINWKIDNPTVATIDPLMIEFDRIFDYALLQHMILVFDENGEEILGEITISENERKWSFVPESPWRNANTFIQIDSRLEDIAGNNFQSLLDHRIEQVPKDIDVIRLLIAFGTADDVNHIKE